MPVTLAIFKDSTCEEPLTDDGSFGLFDNGIFNGDSGESQVATRYLANVKTKLTSNIEEDSTSIEVESSYFGVGDIVAINRSEAVFINGIIPNGYSVLRGFLNTTKTLHYQDEEVIAAYDYEDIFISGYDVDTSSGDESEWLRLSINNWDASSSLWDSTDTLQLQIDDISYDEIFTFHRNIRVPAGQGAYYKIDLRWKVRAKRFVHNFS